MRSNIGRAKRRPLDSGWVTDADGRPTAKPDEAYALSPLGGYKGQGLAMAVTLLGGVLTGTPLDWQLSQVGEGTPGQGRGVGHFLIALDPHAFAGQRDFSAGLADLLGDRARGHDRPTRVVRSWLPATRNAHTNASGGGTVYRWTRGQPKSSPSWQRVSASPVPLPRSTQMRRTRRDSRIDQPPEAPGCPSPGG